ncbi:uncharacterized protein [Anabrus simplex]|uniref:uncharacterized protein n=1 Tax=Anabrus simplex TaxID=316456 RepID=UPI0035A392F9
MNCKRCVMNQSHLKRYIVDEILHNEGHALNQRRKEKKAEELAVPFFIDITSVPVLPIHHDEAVVRAERLSILHRRQARARTDSSVFPILSTHRPQRGGGNLVTRTSLS